MKFVYSPIFQSPAEKEIFPILNTYALKNHLIMEYQKQIITEPDEEWWEQYGWKRKEKYRIDFTYEGRKKNNDKIKLAIEIDGKEWHQNIFKEDNRDAYLSKRKGYTMIHIPANDIYTSKGLIKIIQTLNDHTGYEYFY